MKPVTLSAALALTLSALLPTFSARALDPTIFDDYAPLTPGLTQLFTDLETIPAGSTVTDAQHATLVADLTALPPGPSTPDAADLDQLATDLSTAAVAGFITDDEEYSLAADFNVDPTDPDSWFGYVQDEVANLLAPPDTTDPGDGTLPWVGDPGDGIYYPLYTLYSRNAAPIPRNRLRTSVTVFLSPHYYDTDAAGPLPVKYSGQVRLSTVSCAGGAPVATAQAHTRGLMLGQRYRVNFTRASDGASMVAGKFAARARALPAGGHIDPISIPSVDKTWSDTVFGNTSTGLPGHLNVTNVSAVTITDRAGRVLLSHGYDPASLMTGAIYERRARLYFHGGKSAAAARGNASLLFKMNYGTLVADQLVFSAAHLPANASVTLSANGTAVGQYMTTAQGRLLVTAGYGHRSVRSSLPPLPYPVPADLDFSKTKSLSLTDAQGTVLLKSKL